MNMHENVWITAVERSEHLSIQEGLHHTGVYAHSTELFGVFEQNRLFVAEKRWPTSDSCPESPGRFWRCFRPLDDPDEVDVAWKRFDASSNPEEPPPIVKLWSKYLERRYLDLMRSQPDVLDSLARDARTLEVGTSVCFLLEMTNWRDVLVGCAAAVVVEGLTQVIDGVWLTFDRDNWAGPQLAATLRLVDEQFADHARARLEEAHHRPKWLSPKTTCALEAMYREATGDDRFEGSFPADFGDDIARRWYRETRRLRT